MPFKDLPEGQTHHMEDGHDHSLTSPRKDWEEELRDLYLTTCPDEEGLYTKNISFNWGTFHFNLKDTKAAFYLTTQESIEDFIRKTLAEQEKQFQFAIDGIYELHVRERQELVEWIKGQRKDVVDDTRMIRNVTDIGDINKQFQRFGHNNSLDLIIQHLEGKL